MKNNHNLKQVVNAQIVVPGDRKKAIQYSVDQFIAIYKKSVADHGFCAVALSGGSTPKEIYKEICSYSDLIDWSHLYLFWSDERSVPPFHPESNYSMAFEAGFGEISSLPHKQIYRMVAERDIEAHALLYEKEMEAVLKERGLDLVMLGMGEDGHTASLFPGSSGLSRSDRKVIAQYVEQKESWRMTFTLDWINRASAIRFYVLGSAKAAMVVHLFTTEPYLPCQWVGIKSNRALWILDEDAASLLNEELRSNLSLPL